MLEEEAENSVGRLSLHDDLLKWVAFLRHILGEPVYYSPEPLVDGRLHAHVPATELGAPGEVLLRLHRHGSSRPINHELDGLDLPILQCFLRTLSALHIAHGDEAARLLAWLPHTHDVDTHDHTIAFEEFAQNVFCNGGWQISYKEGGELGDIPDGQNTLRNDHGSAASQTASGRWTGCGATPAAKTRRGSATRLLHVPLSRLRLLASDGLLLFLLHSLLRFHLLKK
mmetsp:Transcript_47620/g.153099  ORF Transcript_47620/g.153099 Transcript_47620/m.153099 type:complete len:227 (+) Transcript_47620:309-989(+)